MTLYMHYAMMEATPIRNPQTRLVHTPDRPAAVSFRVDYLVPIALELCHQPSIDHEELTKVGTG